MHIAHFTNTYNPNVNGVVRSVSTFREGLIRLGHQVFVFAQEAPADYVEPEPFIFRYRGVNIPKFNYSITAPTSTFVNRLLPSLKLDVIHSNHPILLGDAAAKQARRLGLPLVFTFHTRYVEYTAAYAAYVPHSQAFVEGVVVEALVRYIRQCHHIITPSDSIRDNLINYAGIVDQVTTIPTGIDLAPFRQADGQAIRQRYKLDQNKVLVSIGRLSEEKNWSTLLDAVAQVAKQRDDVRLILIGDGPQRSVLEDHARKLGLTRHVIFTGLVPFDEIPDHLKAADLFCFASTSETQGLVTMEAMAADLPVVAVDATGTRDAVENGQQGLLTSNDSAALAQAILQLLDNADLYTRLKAAVHDKAETFDMMLQAQRAATVYEQAIEDKKANRRVRVDVAQVKRRLKDRAPTQ